MGAPCLARKLRHPTPYVWTRRSVVIRLNVAKPSLPRVLCVDDEPAIVEGIARNLRRDFDIATAASGAEALDKVRGATFEVVMSDMRMPAMDGVTLLTRVREISPTSVRVLLTGQTDFATALLAVNEGNVFRFLTKPCPPDQLGKALRTAVEQHRLITAEKVLLEQTLRGAVQALVRVLALSSPEGFGRASRVKDVALKIAAKLELHESWFLEVAAMMSEMGSVVLPPDVLAKIYHGDLLTPEEEAMAARAPEVTDELLSGIPRLDAVREILQYSRKHFDGDGSPKERIHGDRIPLGARILKVASDYDRAASAHADERPIDVLQSRAGHYDPTVLEALAAVTAGAETGALPRQMSLVHVRAGMTFAADVRSKTGLLLVAHGQRVTAEMLERLRNVAQRMGVVEPLSCKESE
jgi:response regulator RpfG family c-di-GMP phosphodiesterase